MLLTRSPLIRPASWSSPFDLHVLSTPPAFVLSQNQTLRECQTATHRPEDRRATDTQRTPPKRGINWHHPKPDPRGGPDPGSTPKIWHRLLGTLLSSQGTDAHPLDPLGPVWRQPFKLSRSAAPGQLRLSAPSPAHLGRDLVAHPASHPRREVRLDDHT